MEQLAVRLVIGGSPHSCTADCQRLTSCVPSTTSSSSILLIGFSKHLLCPYIMPLLICVLSGDQGREREGTPDSSMSF